MYQSQFIEMFGDPVTNSKDWPTKPLSEVAPESPSRHQIEGIVWNLNLDMIESNSGKVISKIYEEVNRLLSVSQFDQGNVLFSKLRPYLNKVVVPDEIGYATTELVPLRPDQELLNKYFLAHLLRGHHFVSYANAIATGTKMPRMPMNSLRSFKCILPPMELQQQFVDIAEQADKSKFSGLKSQFIEMFGGNQYKQAELDTLAKDWQKGQAFKKDNLMDDGKYKCIHYGELFTKYGPIIDSVLSSTDDNMIKGSKKGDILFPASDVTPVGLARCSALMLDDVLLGGDIIVLRPQAGIIPEYLSWAINMQKDQLLKRVTGSVVRHMSAKGLKSVTVPIPPKEIQQHFISIVKQADKSKQIAFSRAS